MRFSLMVFRAAINGWSESIVRIGVDIISWAWVVLGFLFALRTLSSMSLWSIIPIMMLFLFTRTDVI